MRSDAHARRTVSGVRSVSLRAAVAAILLAGCGDPGPVRAVHEVLDRTLVASGRYARLGLLGSAEEEAHVFADRDGALVVVPLRGGEPCEVGPAHWTLPVGLVEFVDPPFYAVVLHPMTPRLWYFDDENDAGWGDLRWTDADCRTRAPLVDDAVEWGWLGSLWRTGGGDVYRVDYRSGEAAFVRSGVDRVVGGNAAGMWLVERGALVLRDPEGAAEIARFGTGVREAAVAMDFGAAAAFVDEDGLSLVDGTTLEVEGPIATDACTPAFLPELSLGQVTLSFRSPCAESRLGLHVPGEAGVRSFDAGVTGVRWLSGGWIFYVVGAEPGARIGRLFAVPPGADAAVLVGEAGDLDAVSALEIAGGVPGDFLVVVDHDGQGGTLGRWTADGLVPLVEDATDPVAANWSIAAPGAEVGTRVLALQGFEGERGALVVVDPYGESVREIGDGVPRDGFRFSAAEASVDYVDRWDGAAGSGRLRTYSISDRRASTIDEGVSELRPVLWPEPGLLYAIPDGDRAGIWFVALDRRAADVRVD